MKKKEINSGVVIYQTKSGSIELKGDFKKETIWATQDNIADLFHVQRPAITKHLKNIFDTGELDEKVVSSILEHTTPHGAIPGKTQSQLIKYVIDRAKVSKNADKKKNNRGGH